MKVEIVAKNFKIYDKLEEIVTKKLERLDKYFDKNVKAKVLVKQERETYILEFTIYSNPVIRAEVSNTEDMYANIDIALAKIIRQLNKHKSKLDDKRMKDFNKEMEFLVNPLAQEKTPKIVKHKTYTLSPLTLEQATVKLDLVGHDFYLFQNADTGEVNVLYKRKDGDLGVIEAKV